MGSTKTKTIEGTTVETNAVVTADKKNSNKKTRVRGKNYKSMISSFDRSKLYSVEEAIEILKKTSFVKFNASVEFHATVKKQDTSVSVSLPHSTGREKKIEIADDATIAKLEKGQVDFDVLLSTAEMMPKLVKFARILGPKGMMPNPKNGTVIKSKEDAKNFSIDKLTLKTEKKFPLIHAVVGKIQMSENELKENIEAILASFAKKQVLKAHLSSTMGPGVKLIVE